MNQQIMAQPAVAMINPQSLIMLNSLDNRYCFIASGPNIICDSVPRVPVHSVGLVNKQVPRVSYLFAGSHYMVPSE